MRIALLHNRYVYRGGEDTVVDTDVELLRAAGHEVFPYFVENDQVIGRSPWAKLRTGLQVAGSRRSRREVQAFLREHRAELGVVHNFFPLLTPSVYAAHRREGIPVVQMIHNYRLMCANGCFLRDGGSCEECLGEGPWHAVRHGCYRDSKLQTAAWAHMVSTHRRRRTWQEQVDAYLAPSEFARGKLIQGGLPAERVHVRPNPIRDPGEPRFGGRGALFVGRLSREKGVDLLLDAWQQLPDCPLSIVGTGPEEEAMRRRAAALPQVELVGGQPPAEVHRRMREASFLVAPSLAYETFGMTVAEAMACGTPALVPDQGALTELVEPEESGFLFQHGDADSLAQAAAIMAADAEHCARMGREAHARFRATLNVERSMEALDAVLTQVRGRASRPDPVPAV